MLGRMSSTMLLASLVLVSFTSQLWVAQAAHSSVEGSAAADWISQLQIIVRATTPMSHQLAAKYYAGMTLSGFYALRANRGGRATGQPKYDEPSVLSFACYTYLNHWFPHTRSANDVILNKYMGLDKTGPTHTNTAIMRLAIKHATSVIIRQDMSGFVDVPDLILPEPVPGVFRLMPNQTQCTYPNLGRSRPFIFSTNKVQQLTDKYVAEVQGYFTSDQYYDDVEYTHKLGCAVSPVRTEYETATPAFWADMAGTSYTPGHYLSIAISILPGSTSLFDQAWLFATLSAAMSDVSIPCFRTKYTVNLWRPYHAITLGDGSPKCNVEAGWSPLLKVPSHPSYPSGHSCISGAAAEVLRSWFGSDDTHVVVGSEGLPAASLRTFTSFSSICHETGRSRVLGGLHYPYDCDAGANLGEEVARAVMRKMGA